MNYVQSAHSSTPDAVACSSQISIDRRPNPKSLNNLPGSKAKPNTIANTSPDEKNLCLSSAGNVVLVLHRYTLGLFNVSDRLVLFF